MYSSTPAYSIFFSSLQGLCSLVSCFSISGLCSLVSDISISRFPASGFSFSFLVRSRSRYLVLVFNGSILARLHVVPASRFSYFAVDIGCKEGNAVYRVCYDVLEVCYIVLKGLLYGLLLEHGSGEDAFFCFQMALLCDQG